MRFLQILKKFSDLSTYIEVNCSNMDGRGLADGWPMFGRRLPSRTSRNTLPSLPLFVSWISCI